MIVVMWMSVVVGWIVAIVAEEELAAGRKYFEWLRRGLFFSGLVLYGFILAKNFLLMFGLWGLVGVGLLAGHFFISNSSFLQECIFTLCCFIWTTGVVLMGSTAFVDLLLVFVSIVFIYGLSVGTIAKMKYQEWNKIS